MSSYRIALAGNPNTGKSTLFNLLTGLRQHTGNWPGKTVIHAEGEFRHLDTDFTIIDLPGTYSLYSNSADEEVARDYIIFDKPDVTLVVLDATSLERNMNLALQVMEMTDRVIVCLNLIDEAKKKGIEVDSDLLSKKLGVPVLKTSARNKTGIKELLDTVHEMAKGNIKTNPYRMTYSDEIEAKIEELAPKVRGMIGDEFPVRWISLRLLDGDESILHSLNNHFKKERTKGGYSNVSINATT
ncbi:FeoB small GTPase domain-containing protein [Bacillus sp. KH172YL63]|uniref:FeoB small GTPase domain-containing protein n=1 Tax=Bacillus sp. KH172YL63 TaxID=2709784 RepID=UPI0013E4F6B1|nr:FeoB small GTPase domain-containing protein [Bacillus sp. KH172YL63]BCB02687.1 iron transporter FeoB [Bacillus sp. KH172YL63]